MAQLDKAQLDKAQLADKPSDEPLLPSVTTVCTNPTIDVSLSVPRLVPEDKLLASDSRRDPGGGGVNVARSLQRLGGSCRTVVTSGGPLGEELKGFLEAEGIQSSLINIFEATRESVRIYDEHLKTEYRIVLPGPRLDENERASLERAIIDQKSDIVVLSGRLNVGLPVDWYRLMQEALRDRIVVVDCPEPALAEAILGPATLVKPSRRELESLVGRSLVGPDDVIVAANEVLERGAVEALLVSMGAAGAVLVGRDDDPWWYSTPPVGPRASTVGCGDAMVSGVVHSLRTGASIQEATRFGIAAGSAAALTPGTTLFQPTDAYRLLNDTPMPHRLRSGQT
jgi:6-phosphofructokinase 2